MYDSPQGAGLFLGLEGLKSCLYAGSVQIRNLTFAILLLGRFITQNREFPNEDEAAWNKLAEHLIE